MKVNILGTKYSIKRKTADEDPTLEEADGYCDKSTKRIVVRKFTKDEEGEVGCLGDMDSHFRKVIRHEAIHAFCMESGLQENANWDLEQMVDWFAIQSPKIYKVFEELEVLE